jgi:2-haloacid dehalogenase
LSSALRGIRACVFDAYGTLFDLASVLRPHGAAMGDAATRLLSLWRAKQLEYTWLRTLMRRHADFWQVTEEALDYAMAALGLADAALRGRLMHGYLELSCFPDAPVALAQLKAAGLRTAVLSNGTPDMLRAALTNSRLASLVDQALSVEQVGCYKPDPRVYRLAVDELALDERSIAFVSANGFDAAGAASFGFPTVRVARTGAPPPETLPFRPAFEIRTLAELLPLLGVETS